MTIAANTKSPPGEFSFTLRVSSDGPKRFLLTQQRNGGSAFPVRALHLELIACWKAKRIFSSNKANFPKRYLFPGGMI